MATTQFIRTSYISDCIDLYETGGTYDTPEFGEPVWLSGGEARTITNVDAPQHAVGLAFTRPASGTTGLDYPKDKIAIAHWPVVVETDNVDATDPPEAGKDVYILDTGAFSDTDTGTEGRSYGQCLAITGSTYLLNLTGPDET